MTIGQWLKQERRKRGLTLLALEECSKISKSTISRIERDETANLHTILAVAGALNLSLVDYYHPSNTKTK